MCRTRHRDLGAGAVRLTDRSCFTTARPDRPQFNHNVVPAPPVIPQTQHISSRASPQRMTYDVDNRVHGEPMRLAATETDAGDAIVKTLRVKRSRTRQNSLKVVCSQTRVSWFLR